MRSVKVGKTSATIEARISAILLEVEPLLRIEHCRIELVDFAAESGTATLQIAGSCPDCEVSPLTFSAAIQAHVRRKVPEVREVRIAAISFEAGDT